MNLRAIEAVPERERLPASVRILVGTGFLVAIGYGVVAPVLPTYAASFGVGVAAASAVVSAFAVFRLLFAPPPVFCSAAWESSRSFASGC